MCRPLRSSKRNKITPVVLALADVAKVQEHIPKVVTCLRTAVDPFPTEMSRVSLLVHGTLANISYNTVDDAESFAKVIASFKPSDVKPLASIRHDPSKKRCCESRGKSHG